jgi:hypothetical protein
VIGGVRDFLKRLIAGLVLTGWALQTILFAAHLSIMFAANSGPAFAHLPTIICTANGAVTVADDELPAKQQPRCVFCPLCWNPTGGDSAILPSVVSVSFESSHRNIAYHSREQFVLASQATRPRSRGPPDII